MSSPRPHPFLVDQRAYLPARPVSASSSHSQSSTTSSTSTTSARSAARVPVERSVARAAAYEALTSRSSTQSAPAAESFEHFALSTTAASHQFGSTTPRNSQAIPVDNARQQDKQDKKARRKGMMGRLF